MTDTQIVNKAKIKAHNIAKGGKCTVVAEGLRLKKIMDRILYCENVDAGKIAKDPKLPKRYMPKDSSKVIKSAPAPTPAPKAVPVLNHVQNLNNRVNDLTAKVNELEKRLAAETIAKQAILKELGQTKLLLNEVKNLL